MKMAVITRVTGEDEDKICFDAKNGKTIAKVNPKFYRPAEIDLLIGDPQKAKDVL